MVAPSGSKLWTAEADDTPRHANGRAKWQQAVDGRKRRSGAGE
jgi:hypothetical protein